MMTASPVADSGAGRTIRYARGCDALLDRAAMERMLALAQESGEPFLYEHEPH